MKKKNLILFFGEKKVFISLHQQYQQLHKIN